MRLRTAGAIALLVASTLSASTLVGCHSFGRIFNSVPTYYDLGGIHRTVSTDSAEAQLWFDRGLGLTFGFNHEEAIRCFDRAIEADPTCAMAYWGKAYALGPNYNNPVMTEETSRLAHEATQKALAITNITPVERALIEALDARYPYAELSDRVTLEKNFASAMEEVHAKFPDDADIAAFTAEALLQLRPWKLWSPDGKAAPETPRIRAVLEPALERWPNHPALCHLYIHTMEASPEVEKALPYARNLSKRNSGLGHLIHMPSHIYIWTGNYADSLEANTAAVAVDDIYADFAGRENFYTLYRVHNYHFIAYSAMFTGEKEIALEAARAIPREIPDALHASAGDFTDIFVATPYHVMVRFGMWEELVTEPQPPENLPAARAVWSYSQGVAYAALGRMTEAVVAQSEFRNRAAEVPATRYLFQNPVSEVLKVADAVLEGEIEYRRGNYDRAFATLRRAVELDRGLNYDEPWGWMEPAAHALGALLTEQGRFEEALPVYEANLKRFPENGWALFGMAECLHGMGRHEEAKAMEGRFADAWRRATVKIPGSCFCKGVKEPLAAR